MTQDRMPSAPRVSYAGAEPPEVPPRTGDDAPSTAHAVRMVLTPLALAVLAVVFFVVGWTVAGVIAAVFAVALTAAEVAIGSLVVKVALRDHANMFKTLAPLLGASPARGRKTDDDGEPVDEVHEREVDRAVGFGLTRAAAQGGFSSGAMTAAGRERLKANVLEERALTYGWLQEAPAFARVAIEARDGVRLVAEAQVADPASARWVVLCHGYAGTWDSMLQYARRFAQGGYNLLIPHMRAHGSSGGRYIGLGCLDGRDIVAWAAWLVGPDGARALGAAPVEGVVLFGHSMGASSVCLAAGEADLPREVRGLVSDCGFDDSWHALSSAAQAAGVPVHPTVDLARMNLRVRRGGYDIASGDAAGALGRAPFPVLIAHGTADRMVDPSMARVLAEASAEGARVVMVEDAGHCQSSLVDPDLYWSEVLAYCAERTARAD